MAEWDDSTTKENTDEVDRGKRENTNAPTEVKIKPQTDLDKRRATYEPAIRRAREPADLPKEFVTEQAADYRDREKFIRDQNVERRERGEKTLPEPHTISKHRDSSMAELKAQVENGKPYATKFKSDAAIVMAESKAWQSLDAQDGRVGCEKFNDSLPEEKRFYGFSVELPARQLLGPEWRSDMEGWAQSERGDTVPADFPDDTTVVVQWRRTSNGDWPPHTVFPNVDPYKAKGRR